MPRKAVNPDKCPRLYEFTIGMVTLQEGKDKLTGEPILYFKCDDKTRKRIRSKTGVLSILCKCKIQPEFEL